MSTSTCWMLQCPSEPPHLVPCLSIIWPSPWSLCGWPGVPTQWHPRPLWILTAVRADPRRGEGGQEKKEEFGPVWHVHPTLCASKGVQDGWLWHLMGAICQQQLPLQDIVNPSAQTWRGEEDTVQEYLCLVNCRACMIFFSIAVIFLCCVKTMGNG